jgi:hypothetical protein
MLRARHLVLIALVTACWAGPARSVEPKEKKELVQPWWAVARAGGYTFQSMYGSSVGYLMPVDGPPGGISLGVQEDLLVGVGAGRWFYRWLSVELALSRFDVELGGDDLLEETGEGVPVEIGTCAMHTAQLTLLFGGESSPEKRLSGFVGLDLLHESPGSFDLAEAGQERLGVIEVETRSAVVWGLSVRADARLGRGPWAITMNSTMTLGGSEPFVVHTDPEAGYESSAVSFRPLTITVGFLRRF